MSRTLTGLALAVSMLAVAPAAWANVSVDVNGQPVTFDQPPVIQDGRVLVPLRGVFEKLGATVTYSAQNHSIVAETPTTTVDLTVGTTVASINGQEQPLDTAPIVVGARAMVPLRFVSQALGAQVSWNAAVQEVAITGGAAGLPPSQTYRPPMAAPTIAEISLDNGRLPDYPLRPGQTLTVTMIGTSGGQATFDIAGQSGFQMVEGPMGTYTGQYTVRQSDLDRDALVRVRLVMPDGAVASRNADQPLALGMPEHRRLIQSVLHNGTGTLAMGQSLRITMVGRPGCEATFDVGPHLGLPMQEVSPGTYVGMYTVPYGEVDLNAPVVAHLMSEDGERATLLAPPSVSFFGRPR